MPISGRRSETIDRKTISKVCYLNNHTGCSNSKEIASIEWSMSKRGMLIRFSTSVADLSSALADEIDLTEEERLFIENHLLMLQMAYTGWKGRHGYRDTEKQSPQV